MERAPIKDTIVQVIFEAMSVNVRLVLAVRLRLTGAYLVTPKDSMRTLRCATVASEEVVFSFRFQRSSFFRRLNRYLGDVVDAPFVVTNRCSFFVVSDRVVAFFVVKGRLIVLACAFISLLAGVGASSFLNALLTNGSALRHFRHVQIYFFFAFCPMSDEGARYFALFVRLL